MNRVMLLKIVLIVMLLVAAVLWFLVFLLSPNTTSDLDKSPSDNNLEAEDQIEIKPDPESVEIDGITVSFDVAKIILLNENSIPKCTVLTEEGQEPDPRAVEACDQINQ